jgi:hypothetical protein
LSHRTFTDAAGVEWEVWDVFPSTDVRHTLQGGWLTFQSPTEKRRLAPVPLYWVNADDGELRRLLQTAKPVVDRLAAKPERSEMNPPPS